MHIFLLDDNVSVSRVTELQKYLNDVVVRSWQNMHVFRLGRDSLLLKKKNRKWIDNHPFKTSTFSYWTRMCHVSHSFKIYFYDVIVGGGQSALVFCRTEEEHILSPLAPDVFLLKQNDRTLNQFMSMSIQMGFFFAARSQKCTEHLFYIERLWSFYLTKISYFKLFFLVMLLCYICTCNHCLPRLANCLTVNTSFYKEKFSFKASMFQLV